MQRIVKFIVCAGYCSRKKAEQLIVDGVVTVNDVVIKHSLFFVKDDDIVKINKETIFPIIKFEIWLYYKPRGLLVTKKDCFDRPTIFNYLPKNLAKFISIGRLDMNSEGLLLLTNNSDFASYMELPANKIIRKYKVKIFGNNFGKLQLLNSEIVVDGVKYQKIEYILMPGSGANRWVVLSLVEGKNREIRKIMHFLDFRVIRLIRIAYGDFNLGNLKSKEVQKVVDKKLLQKYLF